MTNPDDPYNLSRFVHAQEDDYEQAISELRDGRKRSHWIWYIFPQIDGLAFSSTSKRYAIRSAKEARAYLDHPDPRAEVAGMCRGAPPRRGAIRGGDPRLA